MRLSHAAAFRIALVIVACAAFTASCRAMLTPVCKDGTLSCTNDEQIPHPRPWIDGHPGAPQGAPPGTKGGLHPKAMVARDGGFAADGAAGD